MMQAPAQTLPQTVKGHPLNPGERVIYYWHDTHYSTRVGLFFLGLFLVVIIVGLVMIWAAFTDQSETFLITNQRFIFIEKGKLRAIPMGQVKTMTRVMKGGLKEVKLAEESQRGFTVPARNHPEVADVLQRFIENPALVQQAPSVPYEA